MRSHIRSAKTLALENERKLLHKADQSLRYQKKKGIGSDLEFVNICSSLGIDYFASTRETLFSKIIPNHVEGKRVEVFSTSAKDFILTNYKHVEEVLDDRGVRRFHFKQGEPMGIFDVVAEKSEQPRKVCKLVYEKLVEAVQEELKAERKSRLKGLGIISIKFKEARKGGKTVDNPFRPGEKMKTKSRPASNRLKFRPSKDLKQFVEKKISVQKPPDKKKKKK